MKKKQAYFRMKSWAKLNVRMVNRTESWKLGKWHQNEQYHEMSTMTQGRNTISLLIEQPPDRGQRCRMQAQYGSICSHPRAILALSGLRISIFGGAHY
ncbi:hypothetical protein HAX54_012584 [Datura stramonium]|uniref:Uncharacterized protein n=1 Tax=Datura stramonium TaxID=4076 RepID=A0ABS8Y472_DATST|nr:hypothetical protein [Datura stramonium]